MKKTWSKKSRDTVPLRSFFNQDFLCMRLRYARSFKSFSLPYTIINFLFASWNFLLILKTLGQILPRIPYSVIGRCFLVPTSHLMHGKCARIKLSQAASGMTLQNHRWLPVRIFSALGSLIRSGLLKGFSKLLSNFKGASRRETIQ
jgi:hypothetical protein